MRTPAKNAAIICLLLALPAGAAGPLEGVGTASEAAVLRAADAELVEIEGFTGPEGDIPCSPRSYSNNWRYKFYSRSSKGWLLVHACGSGLMNVAKHFPGSASEEPTESLPPSFSDPESVLKKMEGDGVFRGAGDAQNREILMKLRRLPEKDGREEGCYWTVSQGKAKALADCGAKKSWKLGEGTAKRLKVSPRLKGKDTAGRYSARAAEMAHRQDPGAQFFSVESLVDRSGSAKCLVPDDGWTFVFRSPTLSNSVSIGACNGKVAMGGIDFSGKFGGTGALAPVPLHFKDSDTALSNVPPSCVKNNPTILMKLQNFKLKLTPFAGHTLIWTVDCGSSRYLVDGYTGAYLGPGKK